MLCGSIATASCIRNPTITTTVLRNTPTTTAVPTISSTLCFRTISSMRLLSSITSPTVRSTLLSHSRCISPISPDTHRAASSSSSPLPPQQPTTMQKSTSTFKTTTSATPKQLTLGQRALLAKMGVRANPAERKRRSEAHQTRTLDEVKRDFPPTQGFIHKTPANPGGAFSFNRKPVVIANAVPLPETRSTPTQSPETRAALRSLRESASVRSGLYAFVEVMGKQFDVQRGDVIVTEHFADRNLGDVLVLDRVSEIGSQTTVLTGNPYIHPTYHCIRAVVVSHVTSKPRVSIRSGRIYRNKRVEISSRHTLLRVLSINVLPDESDLNVATASATPSQL